MNMMTVVRSPRSQNPTRGSRPLLAPSRSSWWKPGGWTAPLLAGLALAGLSSTARALDLMQCQVLEQQALVQTSPSAPALAGATPFSFTAQANPLLAGWASNLVVTPPGGSGHPMTANADGNFVFTASVATGAQLASAYPAGNYMFAYQGKDDGATNQAVSLASGSFPPAPQLSNFAAAQAINADNDFTVQWAAWSGAGAQDSIQLAISDNQGSQVFSTPSLGDTSMLSGQETSVLIPSGTLTAGTPYTGTLSFYHLTPSTSFLPVLIAGYVSQTTFALTATNGSSTGGGTTNPPALAASFPLNQASNVVVVTMAPMITFSFDQPMATNHAILWSANIATDKLTYAWVDPTVLMCTYAGSLLAGATVTWALNPTTTDPNNFRSQAGVALPVGQYSGQFSLAGTPGGTNTPCGSTNSFSQVGGFTLGKTTMEHQTNATTLVADLESGADFMATVSITNALSGSGSVLIPPGLQAKALQFFAVPGGPLVGTFFDGLTNQANLDAAYPVGNYLLNVSLTAGATNTALVTLPAFDTPTPMVLNYDAGQAIDPTTDFTLSWTPFSTATGADSTSLSITQNGQPVFQAPDLCLPRALAPTAGSVVIPKGTLVAAASYEATLTFTHLVATNLVLQPLGLRGAAMFTRTTAFTLVTLGGTPPQPIHLGPITVTPDGQVTLQVTGTVNKPLTINSSADLRTWQAALTTNLTTSPLTVTFKPQPAAPSLFFRGQQ